VCALASPSLADKIKHPTAVFSGLDKITGRIISYEVGVNETVQFGSLQVTPRVCFSRPTTEAPRTDAFVEVDELQPDRTLKRIFSGWIFADSPGLHGIEHPIYDIWLNDCKGDGPLIHEAPEVAEEAAEPPGSDLAVPPGQLGPDGKPLAPPTPRPKPKPTQSQSQTFDLGIPTLGAPSSGRSGARSAPIEITPIPPADVGR